MRRRLRLLPTFLAGCLALVMLGFGVYALTTPIVYDISGNISYTTTDTLGVSWSGSATVYYYSETEKSGYWHYDGNNNPVLW